MCSGSLLSQRSILSVNCCLRGRQCRIPNMSRLQRICCTRKGIAHLLIVSDNIKRVNRRVNNRVLSNVRYRLGLIGLFFHRTLRTTSSIPSLGCQRLTKNKKCLTPACIVTWGCLTLQTRFSPASIQKFNLGSESILEIEATFDLILDRNRSG